MQNNTLTRSAYDTTYRLEQFPHEDLYRDHNSVSGLRRERPSLLKLHEARGHCDLSDEERQTADEEPQEPKNPVKLGWCSGVMLRGVLSIIGTMLFLRHGYIFGQAGLLLGSAIVIVSTSVCLITAFSLSAIATNGIMKGGGAYFLLSRSLGPEWGSAIGIILTMANCLGCSLCVVGFAETVKGILVSYGFPSMIDPLNDIRIMSVITLCMLIVIVMASIRFETAIMYFLFVVLIVSLGNFVVGSFTRSNPVRLSQGFVGYSCRVVRRNLRPKFYHGMSVGKLYGIFFPSMTGVLAGVNISGNLKDPAKAIPKGTILALLFSSFIYLSTGLIFGATTLPVAPGSVEALFPRSENCSELSKCSLFFALPSVLYTCKGNGCLHQGVLNVDSWDCLENRTCKGGPIYNYNIMKVVSAYPPLIYAGIFAATLSSASAAFVAGPKVFQALCRDKILPKPFSYFAVGNRITDEPQRIYILEFLVNCCLVLIGSLNHLAVLVAEFTMVSYVFINYAAFDMALSKTLGWRPAFRWYNKHLSLFGAVASLISMFVVSWWSALMTFFVVMLVFIYVKRRNPNVNWGSSTHAQLYTKGLKNLRKYTMVGDHVKNFRPQCLILTGFPADREQLVRLFTQILKVHQLGVCGNVLSKNDVSLSMCNRYYDAATEWLQEHKIKLFYAQILMDDLRSGVRAMMQCTGIGQCRPNVVVLGFKNNWCDIEKADETRNYFDIIHDAFDLCMGVVIARFTQPTAYQQHTARTPNVKFNVEMAESDELQNSPEVLHRQFLSVPVQPGKATFTIAGDISQYEEANRENQSECQYQSLVIPSESKASSIFAGLTPSRKLFRKEKKSATIDIWWLFDDGGLTILLPYMLSKCKQWSDCNIRVFSIIDQDPELTNQRSFANLLAKFRISYEAIHTVDRFDREREEKSLAEFYEMVKPFVSKEGDSEDWKIKEEELKINKTKTLRQVRLRQALLEHSSSAKIIFITMNVPRKETVSAHLYLAWLEFISRKLPPVLFVRGNQESVLTFYT